MCVDLCFSAYMYMYSLCMYSLPFLKIWKKSLMKTCWNVNATVFYTTFKTMGQSVVWTDPFLINLNVSIQWYLSLRLHQLVNLAHRRCTSLRLHQPIDLADCWCTPSRQWSWKAWTGKDSVDQWKTTLTHQPSHPMMLQKSTPRTWTSRDMVMKDIPYKDHSMLHIGLPINYG